MASMMVRPLRLSILRPRYASRTAATKVHKLPTPGDENDFRPPWFYTLTRVLSWTVIPSVVLYGTFVHDFGEQDHVFRPAREWAERQKASFFTLSPEEQKIVAVEPPSPETSKA
ncbi:hypothetical protein Hypma_000676 [Hypsizygus marmoreus]|uniref:Uncharacterized protein n=1 Tax=Hypsizygus marmoreus TaxID=39966 RepID=A0A369JEG7_HYPMA|nr:hypothetical protein Hypma_000676 [Hypsizygus marmoreus]